MWLAILIETRKNAAVRPLLVLVVLLVAAPFAYGAPRPQVWIASSDPIVIRATGFHARERVTVSVLAPSMSRKRTIRATRRGAVTVRFLGTTLPTTCGTTVVRAAGASGATAVSKNTEPCGIDR